MGKQARTDIEAPEGSSTVLERRLSNRTLKKQGFDINAKDNRGKTLSQLTGIGGHKEMAKLLPNKAEEKLALLQETHIHTPMLNPISNKNLYSGSITSKSLSDPLQTLGDTLPLYKVTKSESSEKQMISLS